MRGCSRFAILAAVFAVMGCDTAHHQEAASLPKIQPKEIIPDPLAEFEQIVLVVKERAAKPKRWLIRLDTTGKWRREELHYVNIRYDVQKTDSLVSPFIGTIQVTEETRHYRWGPAGSSGDEFTFFDSEQDAMRSTVYFYGTDKGTIKYKWRDQKKWVFAGGDLDYPFSDAASNDNNRFGPGEILKRY